jgi:hypothetical protein
MEGGIPRRKDDEAEVMMRTRLRTSVSKDGMMTIAEMSPSKVSKKRTHCRSCLDGKLNPVLYLGDQYLVDFVKKVDLDLPRSPLNLMRCSSCGLLQLEHTVDPDLLYREFWYRSSVNQTMKDALTDLVKTGLLYHHAGTWLDIGANDGYLLGEVPPSFTKIACEPALNFKPILEGIANHVISDFFTADHECLMKPTGMSLSKVTGACDVITSAAMFYDLDDPNKFVADIVKCLSADGVWINQLNDSPTMLRKNAFDAICHEHLCYYDVHALEALYRRHGLVIIGITYNDVNGGSIRVAAEKIVYRSGAILLSEHRRVSEDDAELFASRTVKWKNSMTDLITGSISYHDRLWLYGASTKGCALLQYLDLDSAFRGIADRNPLKYGLKMSGSWLDIYTEDYMRAEKPKHLMVLPWAFRNEFVEREKDLLRSGTTMIFPLPNVEFVL